MFRLHQRLVTMAWDDSAMNAHFVGTNEPHELSHAGGYKPGGALHAVDPSPTLESGETVTAVCGATVYTWYSDMGEGGNFTFEDAPPEKKRCSACESAI